MENIDIGDLIEALVLFGGMFSSYFKLRGHIELLSCQIKSLEEKQMKYNHLQERMASCESSTHSAHHRLDRIDCILDAHNRR